MTSGRGTKEKHVPKAKSKKKVARKIHQAKIPKEKPAKSGDVKVELGTHKYRVGVIANKREPKHRIG